jgi:gliding motility-associated-like protein/uncharacterized repeat protein (TIGR01451 family)
MKQILLYTFLATLLMLLPRLSAAQAPALGTAADFVLFSSSGAVTNTGITHLTGNVGTNFGASTGFGNVDGVMHDQDAASALCASDITLAYNQLNATVPTFFPGVSLGNGQTLNAGVYSISAPATMNLVLNLDGQGDPNAVFIIQINGSFNTGAGAKLILLNGAQACNVFWKVEGAVTMGAGTTMRGTIIANNAAIVMSAGDTLEGRALSTNGAITVNGFRGFKPIGCGSPMLTGPTSPVLGTTECFALFSGTGSVTNVGVTNVTGDVGTNNGATSGFNPLLVAGTIHPVPDGVTAQCATDATTTFNSLNALPFDIDLLYPALFGNDLILTPHVYQLNGSTTFTNSLYLDAQGNPNAVFVIQVNGNFVTSTFSNVVLLNGTLAKNVFWKINGTTTINNNSVFNGTIISQSNINLTTGVLLNGHALTLAGTANTNTSTVTTPTNCAPTTLIEPADQAVCSGSSVSFSVTASGIGLTYQWRKGSTNLANVGNISGATTATLTINPATALDVATDYNVIISGSFIPNDTSAFASLTMLFPPAITTQPTNQTACPGDSVTFVVAASGAGLTYQWRRGLTDLINGGNISGVTNDTLIIDPVNLADAATNYNVVVSGTCLPSVVSNNVDLIFNNPPVIVTQPTNHAACEGNSVTFSVLASGTGLTYQWKKGAVDMVNGGAYSSVTSANMTINPASSIDIANNYSVVISGTCLPNVTSNLVSLSVDTLTTIIAQPTDQTACPGDSVSFTVSPAGSGLSYQWRRGLVNLINGGNISGANNDTLSIDPTSILDAGANYNVVVTGTCLPGVVSNNVELIINTAPIIVIQPTDQAVCEGSPVTFSVNSSGLGLTYQWKKGAINLVNGGSYSGATSANLTINPTTLADIATDYHVVISTGCQPNDTSNLVSLAISPLTAFTTQPIDIAVCEGDSAGFTVVAIGSGLTYQWRIGVINLIDGGAISGANNDTLEINPTTLLNANTNYNVVVTGNCLPAVTSNNIELVINTPPVILTQPTNQTVCEGTSVTFTTVVSGSGLTYQWKKGAVNMVNGGAIAGATSPNLTINPANLLDAATDYHLVISGACQPNDTSVMVSLVVNPLTLITTQPTNMMVCAGDSAGFTVVASGSNLTYQWRIGLINLIDGGAVSGANNDTLTINPTTLLNASTSYNVVVTGICLPSVVSNNVELIINTAPVITTQPTNQTVCEGSPVTFSVVASGSGLTYQWRKGATNLVNGGAIIGATTANLTINPTTVLDVATDYYVVISGACQPNDTSDMVSLTIDTLTSIVTQPIAITACAGDSVAFVVGVTGSGLTYQWRVGLINLIDDGTVTGVTNDTLILNPVSVLNAAINYNVVVTGNCLPSVTSIDVALTINTAPQFMTQPTDQTVCDGGSVTFSAMVIGSALTYQWKKGAANVVDGGSISGATTATLTINPATSADIANDYYLIVSGACQPNDTSNMVSLSIDTMAIIITQPTDMIACIGDSISFVVDTDGSNLSYQWRKGLINIVDAGSVSGATTATLTINPVVLTDAATDYNVVITGACAPPITSIFVALDVSACLNDLSVVKTASTLTPTIGSHVTFTIVATNTGGNATNVTVTDILQDGYTYVSSTTTAGTFDPVTGIWSIGTMLNPSTETLTIKALVNMSGNYDNTAVIAGSGTDGSLANNTSTVSPTPIDFFIPDGFSPNGDMVNDEFVIRGIANFPNNQLEVYNRWGNLVYKAVPYQNKWDGTSTSEFNVGGNVLPVGTYFYVLDLGNGTGQYKGTIYLNK